MSTRHLVDPELIPVLDSFPSMDMDHESLPRIRGLALHMVESWPQPDVEVDVTEVRIPADPAPAVRALLLRPKQMVSPAAAILHIHGGAYIMGSPEMNLAALLEISDALGCVILSVDYRLAPETPFPGAIEDCYAALGWLFARAGEFGVDNGRIAVMGESAGGGLAAALALMARDRGEYRLAFQLLDAPMIDDRTCVRPANPLTGEFMFRPESNRFGWRCLLGQEPGSDGVSPYAAAARAEDLSDLPPAYIATGALDLFLDENVDYAQRLLRAGVPVELHVLPGCPHGFSLAPESAIARLAAREKLETLRRELAG